MSSDAATQDAPPPRSRPGFFRRHKAVAVLLGLLVVLTLVVAGWAAYLNKQLGDIPRFESKLAENERVPKPTTGPAAEAINLLMLGADNGGGTSIEEDLADGDWEIGSHRSDTIMMLHVPASRTEAYLISIPRDSLVRVDGYGQQKINAAFSYGGPDLTITTVERLTKVHIDHVVMMEWNGFTELTNALGGVEVCIPETTYDSFNDRVWRRGCQDLQGERALQYVRTRYGLAEGDFDRIKRQQNFLRETMAQAMDQGVATNPVRFTNMLEIMTDNTTVDSEFTPGEIRELAWSLRSLGTDDVTYLTAPFGSYDDIDALGSVVRLDRRQSANLFGALRRGEMQDYLNNHPAARLGDPSTIS